MTQNRACPRHPGEPSVAACSHCGVPLCQVCVEQYGCFCSPACRRAVQERLAAANAGGPIRGARQGTSWALRIALALVLVVLFVVAGRTIWLLAPRPGGRVAWVWDQALPAHELEVLGGIQETVLIRAGESLVALETHKGTERWSHALGKLGGRPVLVLTRGDAFFLLGPDGTAVALGSDGTEQFKADLGAAPDLTVPVPDTTQILLTTRPPQPNRENAEPGRATVRLLDETTGTTGWTKRLRPGIRPVACDASSRLTALALLRTGEDMTASTLLALVDTSSGKTLGSTPLTAYPAWGPHVSADRVLLVVEEQLCCYDAAGVQQWVRPLKESLLRVAPAGADRLLIVEKDKTLCLDADTGVEQWRLDAIINPGSIRLAGDRLYGIGYVARGGLVGKATQLPSAYRKNQEMLEDMGIDVEAMAASAREPLVFSVDLTHGGDRWNVEHIFGDLCVDETRAVICFDTSETSILMQAAGGKGVTVFRQYDPATGQQLYSRHTDLGVKAPIVVGNRLVGVAYERVDQPGLLNGMAMAGGGVPPAALQPRQGIGIVGVSVR